MLRKRIRLANISARYKKITSKSRDSIATNDIFYQIITINHYQYFNSDIVAQYHHFIGLVVLRRVSYFVMGYESFNFIHMSHKSRSLHLK